MKIFLLDAPFQVFGFDREVFLSRAIKLLLLIESSYLMLGVLWWKSFSIYCQCVFEESRMPSPLWCD